MADFPPFSMGCRDVSFGEQRACNRQVQGCRRFHGKPATDSGFPSLYSRPCNPARFPKVSLRSFTLNFSKIQGLPLTRSAILIAFLSSSSRNRKPSPTLHSGSDAFHSRGFLSWLDDLQVDRRCFYMGQRSRETRAAVRLVNRSSSRGSSIVVLLDPLIERRFATSRQSLPFPLARSSNSRLVRRLRRFYCVERMQCGQTIGRCSIRR